MYWLLRNRLRQYPALINCTTIDWFMEWPQEALLEVADKYLKDVDLVVKITGDPVETTVSDFAFLTSSVRVLLFLHLIEISLCFTDRGNEGHNIGISSGSYQTWSSKQVPFYCCNDFSPALIFQTKIRAALSSVFSVIHSSVCHYSLRMVAEMKRYNYVTPTNYLELVAGYKM